MTKTVEIFNLVQSDTLRSRKTADKIAEVVFELPTTEDVNIDFRNIIFASRSFCHELLMAIKNRKNVQLINANSEVKKMCDVATKKPKINFDFLNEEQICLVN